MSERSIFLGVDTSNYTTSLALCENGEVIKNVRRLLPVKSGERGLRQSDAVFLHTKALPELAEELFDGDFRREDIAAVGVSFAPRYADGSYMPCFLAGISFASAVSLSHKIPLYRFSHQAGHIAAGIYSSGHSEIFGGDFLSFHVSGGTTEALRVRRTGDGFDIIKAGGTSDASAGQIIDRAGVFSGLDFPCGKELDRLSENADKKLPKLTSVSGTSFSLSGLQNKYEAYTKKGERTENAAYFIFSSIGEALAECTENLRRDFGNDLPVLFAGGVMGNTVIRRRLSEIPDVYFASCELSSDNAAGIALLCENKYKTEVHQ